MEPLDLRTRPPRDPRERLGGLVLLPRTIDKARAMLPGGERGGYQISPGLSEFLLGKLGISEADFVAIVGEVRDDDEVAARVLAGIDPTRIARWCALLENLRVDQVSPEIRPMFDRYYGARRPDELVLEVIAADDAAMFASR
jgi:Domain of unknown function (DUF5069)